MSSGIWQRGKEEEGVYGFLVEDIKKEVHRASKLVSHCFVPTLSSTDAASVALESFFYQFLY